MSDVTTASQQSWVTFNVKPSRSPSAEHVWVEIASKRPGNYASAHFLLTRDDAFDLAAQLASAAEWLKREAR